MTSGQRKAHKYIWISLVIVVPIIMVFAVKDLDILSSENNGDSKEIISKEKSLMVFEDDIIKASAHEDFVEIILKSTLKNASSVVYTMNANGGKSIVIGQLTTAGIYKFNITEAPKGIVIFDEVKKIDITKLKF